MPIETPLKVVHESFLAQRTRYRRSAAESARGSRRGKETLRKGVCGRARNLVQVVAGWRTAGLMLGDAGTGLWVAMNEWARSGACVCLWGPRGYQSQD